MQVEIFDFELDKELIAKEPVCPRDRSKLLDLSDEHTISDKYFYNLPDILQKGDVFTITILNRVLTYEIDSILTVKPENISDIMIEKGEDHCTLVTCTPYGVNTHRLLVRGTRVDTLSKKKTYIGAEAYRIDEMIVTPIVALPMLFIFILFVVFQPVKTEYFNEGDVFDGKKKESS